MVAARNVPKLLPGILGTVSDWRIVDSTTIALARDLIEVWIGSGNYWRPRAIDEVVRPTVKTHEEVDKGHGRVERCQAKLCRDSRCVHPVADESVRAQTVAASSIGRGVRDQGHHVRQCG